MNLHLKYLLLCAVVAFVTSGAGYHSGQESIISDISPDSADYRAAKKNCENLGKGKCVLYGIQGFIPLEVLRSGGKLGMDL